MVIERYMNARILYDWKNKKVLAGGAVFFAVAFWFYIKPNMLTP